MRKRAIEKCMLKALASLVVCKNLLNAKKTNKKMGIKKAIPKRTYKEVTIITNDKFF